MTHLLLIFTITVTLASAQSLQEFHQALAQSNIRLENAFTKYKKSLDLTWMDISSRKQTLAEIDSTQATWKAWATKESELRGKISGKGSDNLSREESLSHLIDLVDARTNHLKGAVRGFDLPAKPSENDPIIKPKPGQDLRKKLCDAFRPVVASEAKIATPSFVINSLNVMGNWAFLSCTPQNANGSKIDWSKTAHTDIASGEIDEIAVALIAKDQAGQWQVISYGIGATDAWWFGWTDEYGIPKKLLQ